MNGMKSGAGSDPFADEGDAAADADADDAESGDTGRADGVDAAAQATTDHEADATTASEASGDRPYVRRRDGVKDERKLVQFFLRSDVYDPDADEKRIEADLAAEVENPHGQIHATDIREALVAVALEHRDEIPEQLLAMGYERAE